MSYGRGHQRSAISDRQGDLAMLGCGLVQSILRTWGVAVLAPYGQETDCLLRRESARNLVFVEATVALPVGVES
jgi:hypothetical protein